MPLLLCPLHIDCYFPSPDQILLPPSLLPAHPQANLRRWLLHFRREQILLLDSHDLFHAPTQTLQRVLDFVGLPVFTPDVDRALKKGQNKGADCGDHEDHYVLAQVSESVCVVVEF